MSSRLSNQFVRGYFLVCFQEEDGALTFVTAFRLRRRGHNLRFVVVTLGACLAASHLAVGQWMGKQTGCYADSIVANPNRPTVANPADITQYGVVELEYGWNRLWPGLGVQQTSVGGLLKFGMLCDVELRWNTTSFLSQTDESGTTGVSETIALVCRSEFTGRRNGCQR